MKITRFCQRLRRLALPGFGVLLVISALPGAGRLGDRAAWRAPVVQRQFSEWSTVLERIGVSISRTELETVTWDITQSYLAVRDVLQGPVRGLVRVFGLEQSWTLFATPQTDPSRLAIEVETEAGWQILYQSRSEAFTWRRAFFDQHRVRKFVGRLGRTKNPKYWDGLVDWIARRVFHDIPGARRVRVSLFRWHTPEPGAAGPWIALSERGHQVHSVLRRAGDVK